MKKLVLMTMTVAALSGACNTQCFSLWPSSSQKQDNLSELKHFLLKYGYFEKAPLFNDQNNTITTTIVEVCSPEGFKAKANTLKRLNSQPEVIKVTERTLPTRYDLIGVGMSELIITLKTDVYQEIKIFYAASLTK